MLKDDKKTAIYCRVAQADNFAIERQKSTLKGFSEQQGYANPVLYIDNGFNGLNFNRPSFKKLNTDINAGKIDRVIVLSISRLGRNTVEVLKWVDRVKTKGVSVITVKDGFTETDSFLINKIVEEFHQFRNKKYQQKACTPCGYSD